MNENAQSIVDNVKIAVANNGGHLSAVDAGAVSVLYRLSVLLDAKFDAGDTSDLAQLIARHANLMDALLLTPKSRNIGVTPVVQDVDYGKDFSEAYLRLVTAPNPKQTSEGAKPRASGGTASRKRGDAANGLAKARNGPSTGS